jgi:hypothetical protein
MNKDTLKKLRLIVPGIIVLLYAIPLYYKNISIAQLVSKIKIVEGVTYTLLVVIFGVLYYTLNLRGCSWKGYLNKIHNNIRTRCREICSDNNAISSKFDDISTEDILHSFYKIVDNDASLTSKSLDVYFNGSILSSVTDLMIISSIFTLIYLLLIAAFGREDLVIFSVLSFVCLLFSRFILIPLLLRRHIKLGNDQLEFIKRHYKSNLESLLLKQ